MKSQIPLSIQDNLRFLIVEVSTQVSSLQDFITLSSHADSLNFIDRSGYAFNLKTRIHNDCNNYITGSGGTETEVMVFRSMISIASNLERIAELCRDSIQHIAKLENRNGLYADEHALLLDRVALGISLIDQANQDSDTQLALRICDIEQKLTLTCNQLLEKYTESLKRKKNTEDLISSLFVAQSVKRMGAALLKIGEAILSGNLGQPININRYHSLIGFVDQLADKKTTEMVVETIAETRSGSAISGISKTNNDEIIAIFKNGKKRKLKEERQRVDSWHQIYPGIAPKILSFDKQGQSAALLIEHLDGLTLESLLLKKAEKIQQEAFKQLCHTLTSVWQTTRRKKTIPAAFMKQLSKRMNEVYAIHPAFGQGKSNICGYPVTSFDTLIKKAEKLEANVKPPFSVYIHGDFNTDNIIYDPQEKKINFIDLHRSCYMDYVQDVSVFMVSNYRLQVLDDAIRQRALEFSLNFYKFAASFANQSGDKSFEFRLTLALARSFATSTRFILDQSLAKAMFMRSRFLIEHLLRAGTEKSTRYRAPVQEILLG